MRVLKRFSLVLAVVLLACGVGDVGISISPREATLNANAQLQLSAHVSSAGNKTVLWTSTGGTVDSTGLFTAPQLPGIFNVVATSQADTRRTDTATITVVAPVVVTPASASVAPGGIQAFSAEVAATGDTQMTWSIEEGAAGGTITSAGVYTAPLTSGTFHIVATSVADPSQSGIAVVVVGV
jgi:hypothetical protein